MYFAYTFYPLFYISPHVYDRKLSEKLIFLGYLDVKTRFYMDLTRNSKVPEIYLKKRPQASTVFSVNAQRRLQYSKG